MNVMREVTRKCKERVRMKWISLKIGRIVFQRVKTWDRM